MTLSMKNALAMVEECINSKKISFVQIDLPGPLRFFIGYYDNDLRTTNLKASIEECKKEIAREYILRNKELNFELEKSHIEYIRREFSKLNYLDNRNKRIVKKP